VAAFIPDRLDKMAEAKRNDPVSVPPQPAAGGIAARAMATRTANAPYLADLNPEQCQAVETLDGPVLVLAGAGTGKTRVLTTRIAHILNLGRAHPGEILAVTFTNKAAREMKERVGLMVGQIVEGMPWLGTFHAIGVKILRRHAELVGLKSNFTILDTNDQIRLLKMLVEAEKLDEKRWPARMLAGLIDSWKNRGLTPDQVPTGEAASFANGKGRKLYAAYQERLKTLNAADFGDLLLECIRLFRQNPDVLRQYQQRFKFILVDEYQDTNVAQYLWLRLLAQTASAAAAQAGTASPPSLPGLTRQSIPFLKEDGSPVHDASRRPGDDDEEGGERENVPLAQAGASGGLILRDASLRDAPQDEGQSTAAGEALIPHPEEARSAVSKDGAATMRPPFETRTSCAPQGEGGVVARIIPPPAACAGSAPG
jgi:DNA helicase-2/ATP-dependent DNA helicase PcrA